MHVRSFSAIPQIYPEGSQLNLNLHCLKTLLGFRGYVDMLGETVRQQLY
jgi:hypothetical protein